MNRKELIDSLDGFIWNNSTLHYQASCYLKENPDDFVAQFALYAALICSIKMTIIIS